MDEMIEREFQTLPSNQLINTNGFDKHNNIINNIFDETLDCDLNNIDNDINDINDINDDESDSSDCADYVDEILEENINADSLKNLNNNRKRKREFKVRTKVKNVLIKRGKNLFEILPEDWVEITHYTGIPIYLNKKTRVCCTTKPYFIGAGSARKHQIPLSAIPCLQYKTELAKEREFNNFEPKENAAPVAKVETVKESKDKLLNHNNVTEYCKRLFEFKTVTMKKFANWAERRKHEQAKKNTQPSLPESTKLITVPKTNLVYPMGISFKKEFIMNPAGKSSVCILHEYVQHMERTQPKYIFEELENVSKPYCATVFINDIEYGKGFGSSKKDAKTEAARASLNILIPDLKNDVDTNEEKSDSMDDLNFFDDVNIDDQRVTELCLKAGQYSPYQVLVECIKRLYGFDDMEIKTEVKLIRHHRIEFKMIVGMHVVTVICRNKREGKQWAAQKILKCFHPNLKTWGSLLKLYGQGSCKTTKEKREEEQKITELQNIACCNKPNYAILNKLREEMLKLRDKLGY